MFGRRRLACSFCGKGAAEVAKLVAGPRVLVAGPQVHICDQCVVLATQVMEQRGGDEPRDPEPRHGLLRRGLSRLIRAWRGYPRSSQRQAAASWAAACR